MIVELKDASKKRASWDVSFTCELFCPVVYMINLYIIAKRFSELNLLSCCGSIQFKRQNVGNLSQSFRFYCGSLSLNMKKRQNI